MSVSILMVGSEVLPFSKTGGLADVLGALPIALGKLGLRVAVVTPKYRGVHAQGASRTIQVPGVGGAISETRVVEVPLAHNVKVVLVDRPELYDRDSIYGAGGDYPDSPRRFGFLCRAALEYAIQATTEDAPFDILHGHDWQAGLAAVYLRTRYASEPKLRRMASIFTIHNLAYQGSFAARLARAARTGSGNDVDRRDGILGSNELFEGRDRIFRSHYDRQSDLRS